MFSNFPVEGTSSLSAAPVCPERPACCSGCLKQQGTDRLEAFTVTRSSPGWRRSPPPPQQPCSSSLLDQCHLTAPCYYCTNIQTCALQSLCETKQQRGGEKEWHIDKADIERNRDRQRVCVYECQGFFFFAHFEEGPPFSVPNEVICCCVTEETES